MVQNISTKGSSVVFSLVISGRRRWSYVFIFFFPVLICVLILCHSNLVEIIVIVIIIKHLSYVSHYFKFWAYVNIFNILNINIFNYYSNARR